MTIGLHEEPDGGGWRMADEKMRMIKKKKTRKRVESVIIRSSLFVFFSLLTGWRKNVFICFVPD